MDGGFPVLVRQTLCAQGLLTNTVGEPHHQLALLGCGLINRYPVKTRDAATDNPVGIQPPLWVPGFPFTTTLNGDLILMTGVRCGTDDGWVVL